MLLFAWKAAVFPRWGSGLLCVAVGVIANHLMLPLKKFSWQSKALMSTGAAIVVAAMIVASGPVRRPFALFRANLSGQSLANEDLRGAYLTGANLTAADLINANLTGANLSDAKLWTVMLSEAYLNNANLSNATLYSANLTAADLINANLTGANLNDANLTGTTLNGANLTGVDLSEANLSHARLSKAKNLTQKQLAEACGNGQTKLPEGLTLKPCN